MKINKKTKLILIVAVIAFLLFSLILTIKNKNSYSVETREKASFLISENFLVDNYGKKIERIKVIITAYSSSPDETDETPLITANGSTVKEGIVANNLLPFGTEIRIPELYGDKIFVVADRMHPRKGYYHVDIWLPTKADAVNFGAKKTYIEVVKS